MNQNEFNNMTPDRLELLICYQSESTELEQMLVKKLVEFSETVTSYEEEDDLSSTHLEQAEDELEASNGKIEELEDVIGDIKFAAEEVDSPEGAETAITDILELLK